MKTKELDPPVLPAELTPVPNLFDRAAAARETDEEISGILAAGLCGAAADLGGVHFSGARFERCRLPQCVFRGSSFTDVVFHGCDLSACDFSGGYFNRCHLEGCKGIGVNLSDARIHQFTVRGGSLQYASVNDARLNGAMFTDCDLSGADIVGCVLKNTLFSGARMNGASFFKTPLKGIDLTGCQIEGLRVSAGGPELRGVIVDLFQAAELAKLLGIVVK